MNVGQRAIDSPAFATKAATASFDRFYAGMAWLLVLVAIAGFAPRSIAIVSGKMAVPPLVVHLHAAVMASWVSLLAVQATLSLAGRMDLHRKFGLASLVVGPLVLIDHHDYLNREAPYPDATRVAMDGEQIDGASDEN